MSSDAHLLESAAAEITRLRTDNQRMAEKLWLVENLLELRHLRGPSQGASVDVAWECRERARHLQAVEDKRKWADAQKDMNRHTPGPLGEPEGGPPVIPPSGAV